MGCPGLCQKSRGEEVGICPLTIVRGEEKKEGKEMRKRWMILTVLGILLFGSAMSAIAAVESTFQGQFRVNYYSLSQDEDVGAGIAAARLRWRPTWDAKISDDVSMHMQLNIGHIQGNTSNPRT